MRPLKLAVVIVNWNGRDMLKSCLRSLEKGCGNLPTRTWVVDNASTDGSVEMIKSKFPRVSVIMNKRNAGFGKACNVALRKIPACRYVLFLNPDTTAGGSAIPKMAAYLDEHPEAGAATCALTDQWGSFQKAQGHRFPRVGTALNQYLFLNRLISDRLFPGIYWARRPRGARHVDWISGAAMMVRRSAIRLPFFNEDYFMYAEDMEASLDLAKRGWKMAYLPDIHMVHHVKASIRKSGRGVFKTQVTSPLLFLKRHAEPFEASLIRSLMFAGFLLRWALFAALSLLRPGGPYEEKRGHHRAYLSILAESL